MSKAKTGVDLSASSEMRDSPGSQIQWICTKENHIAKLSIGLLLAETDAFRANFLAKLPGHGPGSMWTQWNRACEEGHNFMPTCSFYLTGSQFCFTAQPEVLSLTRVRVLVALGLINWVNDGTSTKPPHTWWGKKYINSTPIYGTSGLFQVPCAGVRQSKTM